MIFFIIYIAIIFALSFIIYKSTKSIWKVIILALIFTILVTFLIAYLVYKDVKSIINEPKLILLESNQKIQTGYIISKDAQKLVTQQDLTEINNHYKIKDLARIRNDTYKLIVLTSNMFVALPESISFENTTYTKQNLLLALDTETPEEFSSKLKSDKENLIGSSPITNEDLIKHKAAIAGILLSKLSEDPKNLIKSIKGNNLKIYPNSITITLLRQLPTFLLESQITQKLSEIKREE